MDNWLRFLDILGELNQSEYNVAMLGTHKFVVRDYHFQPAASWEQKYQTYDAKNKQFIVVMVMFYDIGKSDDISCYPDVKEIFGQVEYTLSQMN